MLYKRDLISIHRISLNN